MAWDPAIRHDAGDRTHRVSAAAEADQKYAVAVFVKPDDRRIAVDDIAGDPNAGRHTGQIVEPAHPAVLEVTAVRCRAETGLVERHLLGRIDPGIRPHPACPVELVNICPRLIEISAARLSGAIRKDHNILLHRTPISKSALDAYLYQRL